MILKFNIYGDAYSNPEIGENRIYLYSLEKAKNFPVTDEWYGAFNPVFCPEGKYLYFTSARDFRPLYSWTEWNHVYNDMMRIYLVTLNKGISSPFKPKSDEVSIEKEVPEDKGKSKKGKKSEKK